MEQRNIVLALLTCAFAGAFCAHADITTGWLPTAAGTYTFTDSANWANGDVNGVLSSDWGSAGKQTLQFANDWTGTINVYGGINNEITLAGKNGAKTLNIDGDMHFQAGSMQYSSSQFIFANSLLLDLGGARRNLFVNNTAGWMLQGLVQNGTLAITGTGTINLRDADAEVTCDVELSGGVTYKTAYTSGTSSPVAKTRAAKLTINRSTAHFTVSQVNAVDTITGALRVLGTEPSCSFLRVTNTKAGCFEQLSVGSLLIDDGGVMVVRGSNKLGSNIPGSADTTSLMFDNAPTVVGGIIPGVLGTIEASDNDGTSFEPYKSMFVTYDALNGLRVLAESEFVSDFSSPIAETANLLVPADSIFEVSGELTVNSLLLNSTGYNVKPGAVSGDGKLKVSSGMVMAKPYKDFGKSGTSPQINVALDFGNAGGFIVNAGAPGYRVRVGKPVSGTAGLTFTHLLATSVDAKTIITSGLGSFEFEGTSGDSTYTGDTYIQSGLKLNGVPFLPNGTRQGNVYLNGSLECSSSAAADISINGLYGSGLVYGRTGTLTVGGNDADGDFSGNVSYAGNVTVLANLNKIGAGTQRFSGNIMLGNALNVNAGAIILDGAVTQGAVNVAAGAAIGGSGGITNNLVFAEGAKLAVTVAEDVASCLTVAGTVSGGPVTVDATITSGKWRTPQCILRSESAITASFVRGEGIGSLELRNEGKELWASPKRAGFVIIFR